MQITRQLNSSLMYHLMEKLSVKISDFALIHQGDFRTFKFPHSNIIITMPIDIYVDGIKIEKENYKVYPLIGEVVFNDSIEYQTITANYNFCLVSVVGHTGGDIINPPLLVIENSGDNDYPFELGSALSDVEALFFLHVYSLTREQRDDLCDMIKKALQSDLLIYNYSKGFPLASDGSLQEVNTPITNSAIFTRVSVNKNPLQMTDEIERGRALITVACKYIN